MKSRILWVAVVVAASVVVLAPVGSAHLVHTGCDFQGKQEFAVWYREYLDQFDQNDPDTWTSGIVWISTCHY
ncbi:MAG: hypothetical protein HY556_09315 [Euryarchaeota archaeon]|nr:hypothetical protein [Euryarchaeota archaeon]